MATYLLGRGVDVSTVAERLHHADPALTLRTYDHPDAEQVGKAAAVLGPAVVDALMADGSALVALEALEALEAPRYPSMGPLRWIVLLDIR